MTPLVGRRKQLAELCGLIATAPAVVRLEGEAGVGKTRLLHELLAHPALRAHRRMVGTCQALREPLPLAPLLDALLSDDGALWAQEPDPLLGALTPLLPELAAKLPPALPPLGDPRMERHRRYRAIRAALADAGPAVLVLDDVHWIDSGTAEFLHFLSGHLPDRIAVVLSYRPGELDPEVRTMLGGPRLATIRLDALKPEEAAEMLRNMVGRGRPSAGDGEALMRRTGGIPFAIEEVVRAAVERLGDDCAPDTSLWEELRGDQVPEGFRDAIAQRLSRLTEPARRVVSAAAVFAAPVSEADLFAVAEVTREEGEVALDVALESGLVREIGDLFGCRHELAQQAILATVGRARLRQSHRLAAAALRAAPGTRADVRIANHLQACGDPAGWRRHLELGVDRAMTLGDTAAAVTALRELVTAAHNDAERRRLAVKLGRAALDGLDCAATVALLRDLLATTILPADIRGELRSDLGLLLLNQVGEPAAGYRELELAAQELRGPRPDLAARVMSSLANVHAGHHHVDTHLRWLAEAETLAGALDTPVAQTAFMVNKVTTLMTCGKPEAWPLAERILDEPTDPDLGRHLMRGCLNLADASSWLGHYEPAARYLAHGRGLARKFNAPYTEEQLDVAEVLLDWLRGDWAGLRGRTTELAARHVTLPRVAAECVLITGALAAEAGDTDDALRLLRTVSSESPSAPPVVATARVLMAEIRHRRGGRADVLREIDSAVEVIRRTGMWVWSPEVTPTVVDLLCGFDRHADAAAVVGEHREGLRGLECPASAAALALAEAILVHETGDFASARAGYEVAETMFAALPRPFWSARTALRQGECALAAGDDGIALIRAAEQSFADLGAITRAARCRALLRAHRALPARKRGRPGYGDRLSPRERQAAGLAAAGHSNRQIATALGLSVRTVEQHIARTLHKLRLASRMELATVLPDLDLSDVDGH
ncbi:ATP-binding protein [Actinokineospora xionganensis]|uniref:AAA family ATPase n=1 Tax=Actinokineospora xionganensis TaxID=2684470 RepID=A0ABR7L4F2_9PSEU|nr:AAA family ATPase [Actinokineospora xionganensis]MBC6447566.1 AAA family ATPase [Actinokineospora xionganensis]